MILIYSKNIEIRIGTAEFKTFQLEENEDLVPIMCQNETIWCTQKVIEQLFDCSTDNIGLALKNIYETRCNYRDFLSSSSERWKTVISI